MRKYYIRFRMDIMFKFMRYSILELKKPLNMDRTCITNKIITPENGFDDVFYLFELRVV